MEKSFQRIFSYIQQLKITAELLNDNFAVLWITRHYPMAQKFYKEKCIVEETMMFLVLT